MLESAFYKNLIKPALEAVPPAADGTVLRFKKRPQGAMSAGQPDLEIAYRGRLAKVELKVLPNLPTAKQWQVLRWWEQAGIKCGVLMLDEKNNCTRLVSVERFPSGIGQNDYPIFSVDTLAAIGRKKLVDTTNILRWLMGEI